jgi:hypothetical protein
VLTDPGMTADQARVLGDWVAEKARNVTDIFVTTLTAIIGSPLGCWQNGLGLVLSPQRERSRRCTKTSPRGHFSGIKFT